MNELERLVFGELGPGSMLPSESELADRLEVSRLTVREAVRSVQARGLIEVRQGRRPVVAPLSAGAVEDFFTASIRREPRNFLDLLETRRALEIHIAALAATRAGRAATQRMADSLDAMRASLDDLETFNEADVRFHEELAGASGNQILIFLIEAMAKPLNASRRLTTRGLVAGGHRLDQAIAEHEQIYRCVVNGDAPGAERAMRAHLEQTERSLLIALEDPE